MLLNSRWVMSGIFLPLLLLAGAPVFAQLPEADFTADHPEGCSPLPVAFTNISRNVSASATYKWDLDKGQTATTPNAGAIYSDETTYTITLTVTDGGHTSVKTKTVTVYKKPEVGIVIQQTRGCAPLTVNFTGNVTTVAGATIAGYAWDYGDGKTESGLIAAPAHTYTTSQTATVSLTVKDSHGCSNTAIKANSIEILAPVKASFTADKTALCTAADKVQFTNGSTGPGVLTWQWDFGDGETSVEKQPSHSYATKGIYKPRLTVISSEGCSDTYQLLPGVNMSDFSVDFTIPALVCTGSEITFATTVNPTPDGISWLFSDGGTVNPRTFSTPGEYSATLTASYGSCQVPVTRKINVLKSANLVGIEVQTNGACGAPALISFKDTTSEAIKWQWTINGTQAGATPAVSYNFISNGNQDVNLAITNAAGCTSRKDFPVYLFKPIVRPYFEASTSPDGLTGCEGFALTLNSISSEKIVTYEWVFEDGTTSTEMKPKHTFSKAGGPYSVTLNYITESGCKGTEYLDNIIAYKKPGLDFTMTEANPVCGNTPVHFEATAVGEVTNWNWFYEGDYNDISFGFKSGVHQYNKEGTYTVMLVGMNGTCRDTVVKKDLVTVVPPFPKIGEIMNSCEGKRGTVTIKDASKLVNTWDWDFGDGGTLSYTGARTTVKHDYAATGAYKVVLSGTNGACKTRDSTYAYVLVKQHPVLTIDQSVSCASDTLRITVANADASPYGETSDGDFKITWQPYARGVFVDAGNKMVGLEDSWTKIYKGLLTWLPPGTDSVRVITRTLPFGCFDTSDFVKLKIKGPDARFDITANGVCFNTPNQFADRSVVTDNVPVTMWNWDYGDGILETVSTPVVKHTYADPGTYVVKLKVTDAGGCFDTAAYNRANITGPRADFTWQPALVKPNTNITFYNNSNTYGASTVNYTWQFWSDGSTRSGSFSLSPVKQYPAIGRDTVTLIASNPFSSCRDTIRKVVYIKNVRAAFSVTTSYVNNNDCPPLQASMVNQSQNYTRVSWDFGDGSTAGNVNTPVHNYTNAGKYSIKLYAYDQTDDVDSITIEIEVKGPFGSFVADKPQVCGVPATITFTATTTDVTDLTWDFADGTLVNTQQHIISHTYQAPGAYKPAIIVKNSKGCSGSFKLLVPFVVDTLKASFTASPVVICDSGTVGFTPKVANIAADQLHLPLTWHWNFGTGNSGDTANTADPSFFYNKNGIYTVRLKVTSAAGCVEEITNTVEVRRKTKAAITGVSEICQQDIAGFTGTADGPVQQWIWDFADGATQTGSAVVSHVFAAAGDHEIRLVAENRGCRDTVGHWLKVRALPDIGIGPGRSAVLCLGSSLQLEAHNGVDYLWTPAMSISDNKIAAPLVSPVTHTTYVVQVTDAFGCRNKDSVQVQVVHPFTVAVEDAEVCRGSGVKLSAVGAASYKWISGTNLSNINIADPVVSPVITGQYQVVGYDAYECFTDTAIATVTVRNLPAVSTVADTILLAGNTITLATKASNDVIGYRWSPATYLDCVACASPVSTPRSAVSYIVTASNRYGCQAKDTVNIGLRCAESSVFIPNTFTPNKDRRNDLFYPRGKGIKVVKFFRVYNRLGETVFERRNFELNNPAEGWDGTYSGNPLSNNVFTYVSEMICDGGDTFLLKGTVLLLH
jgi:gliding motility-associated-like protein